MTPITGGRTVARKRHSRPSDSERDRLLADQAVALAECAANALVAAEQLGIKTRPVEGLSLQEGERAVLSALPAVSARIRKKLTKPDAHFMVAEVADMTMAVAEWIPDSETEHQLVLLLIVMKLMDSLRRNLVVPPGRSIERGEPWTTHSRKKSEG
jgi:hypothetical protein